LEYQKVITLSIQKPDVKIIFFGASTERDWYRFGRRLLICVRNLTLSNKNEQPIFQEDILNFQKFRWSKRLFGNFTKQWSWSTSKLTDLQL